MYHNSGDFSKREGYDFDQLYAITKVQVRLFHSASPLYVNLIQFATLLHAAKFEL